MEARSSLRANPNDGAALDGFNRATFKAVTTRELRLEVQLQPEVSGGILEWQVE